MTTTLTPRATRADVDLGAIQTDYGLTTSLYGFAARAGAMDYGLSVTLSDEGDWFVYLDWLSGYALPLLTRYLSHPVLGADATALHSLVRGAIDRAGTGLNNTTTALRGYGGRPRYGYVPGVGTKIL